MATYAHLLDPLTIGPIAIARTVRLSPSWFAASPT